MPSAVGEKKEKSLHFNSVINDFKVYIILHYQLNIYYLLQY